MIVNYDKSHVMMFKKTKNQEKITRVFILGDNIVNYINGYEISSRFENCEVYVKEFLGAKTMHERLSSTNSRIPTREK